MLITTKFSILISVMICQVAAQSYASEEHDHANDPADDPSLNQNRGKMPPTDPPEDMADLIQQLDTTGDGAGEANRFTHEQHTTTVVRRTTPYRVSLEEHCDYLAYYCLKAYKTGKICGRTLYYNYQDFKNYCALDYVNCMERYEVWQIVHMGECFNITELEEYQHYEYEDDFFLDQTYVIEAK